MAFIPKNAEWYVAEFVQELQVAGDDEKSVYLNLVLIRAGSPDEAFSRALSFGDDYNYSYTNTDGNLLTSRFRGLKDLNVVHGNLEHGTEIIYSELDNVSEQDVHALIAAKSELGIFSPDDPLWRRE